MGGKAGKSDDKSKPWISNYPPLRDFLNQIDARCDFQIPYGPARKPTMYVEQWRAPGSAPFIIVVHADQHGWNIFTSALTEKIDATIEDVRQRIYYDRSGTTIPAPRTGPMDEGGE